jgi:hypothetical protein
MTVTIEATVVLRGRPSSTPCAGLQHAKMIKRAGENVLTAHTRVDGLLQLVGLVAVGDNNGVEVLGGAHLELGGAALDLEDLDACNHNMSHV